MTIRTYTKVQKQGIAEDEPKGGATMEYGYGLYVNAYVVDSESAYLDDPGEQGLWATVRVPFDASPAVISKARKRAADKARGRYTRDKGV